MKAKRTGRSGPYQDSFNTKEANQMDRTMRSMPATAKILEPGSSAVLMTPDYMFNDNSGGNPVVRKNNLQKGIAPGGTARFLERAIGKVLLPVDEQNTGSTLNE